MKQGEMLPIEIKEIAVEFNCSYSAILADIAMIKSRGNFTIYPGRNTKDKVLERDAYTCQYCCRNDRYMLVDHVIPVSMGGVGYEYNLVAACASCNSKKGRKVWVPLNIELLKVKNPTWFLRILTFVNK
jgi:hypothetical protein